MLRYVQIRRARGRRMGGKMKASLIRFWRGTSGATAIEYAMIAAGIALAIVAAITKLGATVDGLFVSVLTALK
jgi:pilus assembly protein Flp/PilA